jgi:hypothetical protein
VILDCLFNILGAICCDKLDTRITCVINELLSNTVWRGIVAQTANSQILPHCSVLFHDANGPVRLTLLRLLSPQVLLHKGLPLAPVTTPSGLLSSDQLARCRYYEGPPACLGLQAPSFPLVLGVIKSLARDISP